jgi:hypothetical protein
MTRSLKLSRFLSLAGALACQSPLSPGEREDLREAEARWADRGFTDYSIESRTSCFCAPDVLGWARLEVVDGVIIRVTLLETGEIITDERLSYWETVEDLFDAIHRSNDQDYLKDVTVQFDPALGFPTHVAWIPDESVQDGGSSRSLRNAQPLD